MLRLLRGLLSLCSPVFRLILRVSCCLFGLRKQRMDEKSSAGKEEEP